MSERLPQPGGSDEAMARSGPLPATERPRERTVPLPPVPGDVGPTILGFPAEMAEDPDAAPPTAPASSEEAAGRSGASAGPTFLRRADRVGGLLLILAGVAAGMSLWLPWRRDDGATGFSLASRGVAAFRSGIGTLGYSGLWQPLAVVLGGAVLLLLGLLLFLRARSHRLIGVLALLVAVAAAAGVLVPLAAVQWSPGGFGPGMWCAVAVAGLGVLGALKAMLTAPQVGMRPDWRRGPRIGLPRSV
jgi:hypothetical protein